MQGRGAYSTYHNFLFSNVLLTCWHAILVLTPMCFTFHVHYCVISFFITSVICLFTFLLFMHSTTYCFLCIHRVDAFATCYIDDAFFMFQAFHALIIFQMFNRRAQYTSVLTNLTLLTCFMWAQCLNTSLATFHMWS